MTPDLNSPCVYKAHVSTGFFHSSLSTTTGKTKDAGIGCQDCKPAQRWNALPDRQPKAWWEGDNCRVWLFKNGGKYKTIIKHPRSGAPCKISSHGVRMIMSTEYISVVLTPLISLTPSSCVGFGLIHHQNYTGGARWRKWKQDLKCQNI